MLAISFSAIVVLACQVSDQVPSELLGYGDAARIQVVGDGTTSPDSYITTSIGLSSQTKTISIGWLAKNGTDSLLQTEHRTETTTFTPTALVASNQTKNVIYITGRQGATPILEKWDLGRPQLRSVNRVRNTSSGPVTVSETSIVIPPIHRSSLLIDGTLGVVSDIAVNSWIGQPTGQEQVWVLDYSASTIYAIDRTTGSKTLVLGPNDVGSSRSFRLRRHSIYGNVLWLTNRMWFSEHFSSADPGYTLLIDSNSDGVFESKQLVTNVNWYKHAIFTTGAFLD